MIPLAVMAIGSLAAGAASAVASSYLGNKSTNKSISAQSRENSVNRAFNASESQKSRQWQEYMYNRYQSPSAMVSQYQSAGLNPALMYGQGVSSPSMASSPSASYGSGLTADYSGAMNDSLNALSGVALAAKQVSLMEDERRKLQSETLAKTLEADKTRVETVGLELANAWTPTLNAASANESFCRANNLLSGISLNDQQIETLKTQGVLNDNHSSLVQAKILSERNNADYIRELAANTKAQTRFVKANEWLVKNQSKLISKDLEWKDTLNLATTSSIFMDNELKEMGIKKGSLECKVLEQTAKNAALEANRILAQTEFTKKESNTIYWNMVLKSIDTATCGLSRVVPRSSRSESIFTNPDGEFMGSSLKSFTNGYF